MTKPDILERIFSDKREDLARLQTALPLATVRARAEATPPTLRVRERLRRPGMQLIAEIKKASPVKGAFVAELDHVRLARRYAAAGAAAISVITEERHFQGRPGLVTDIRSALDGPARPALLRKDFLFDPYHIYETRALGADALLLIVAMLEEAQLRDLISLTRALALEPLVEVHNEQEVEVALKAGAVVIGINNRDLRTFEVDLGTTERLRPLIPPDCIVVAESGIQTRADVERLERAGATAILVGESLMLAPDPEEKIRDLLGRDSLLPKPGHLGESFLT